MLACIPHVMSRKRNVPFNQSDMQPSTKRSRSQYEATGGLAGYSSSNGSDNHQSVDLVVSPKPSKSRRVASVKAQLANTSLLIAEHRRSRSPSSPRDKTEEDGAVVAECLWQGPLSPKPETAAKERLQKLEINREGASCSSLSPLSSLGSEWEDEKVGDGCTRAAGAPPKIKTPVLSLIPVTELRKMAEKRRAKKSTEPPPELNGYVRRMASLNARACVSAMMESTRGRRASKQKHVPTEPARECVQDESENPLSALSPTRTPQSGTVMTHLQQTTPEKQVGSASATSLSSSNQYVLLCASPNTLTACGIIRGSDYSEASSINTEGLLWNGDTIHPQSRVYLTPEGTMPHLIVPPVCPVRPTCVHESISVTRALQLKQRKKQRAVKGDNGWCVLGNPIKEVLLLQEGGSKVTRKYYPGIRRKKEELWVRDCIIVRSGKRKQDRPYIAKVGSIWKEDTTGGVMMTLFWYYRPEEAAGIQSTDFQKDELLASQHYDDNSVACIEDKCYVLGLRQYCRYCAQCKSMEEGTSSLDSFSVVRDDPNEMGQLGLDSCNTKRKPASHVFLCHRGYNHISGKLIKSHKH